MRHTDDYTAAVAAQAQRVMQEDLTARGYRPVGVRVTVEDDLFVFDLTTEHEHRRWTWAVDDDVYHLTPDGTDPDGHGAWLSTLAEEDNTDFVHRR